MGESHITTHKHCFESDYNVIANEFINNDDYNENNDTKSVHLLNLNVHYLQELIQETQNNTTEPMLYKLSIERTIPMYENTLLIHRKLHGVARI